MHHVPPVRKRHFWVASCGFALITQLGWEKPVAANKAVITRLSSFPTTATCLEPAMVQQLTGTTFTPVWSQFINYCGRKLLDSTSSWIVVKSACFRSEKPGGNFLAALVAQVPLPISPLTPRLLHLTALKGWDSCVLLSLWLRIMTMVLLTNPPAWRRRLI